MASESAPSAGEQQVAKKPMPKARRNKIILALAVIAVAMVILVWGWSSQGRYYITVSTLVDDVEAEGAIPAKYLDGSIEVMGLVTGWYNDTDSPSFRNFTLVDLDDVNKSVEVTMLGAFPPGFANNVRVIVKGELDSTLPLRIMGISVTVSCPSKY